MFASDDDHKWRKKSADLNKDSETMALMRLLVDGMLQEDDLQRKLHKMSRGILSQGIIGLFTRLCACSEVIAELKDNLPQNCNSCDNMVQANANLKSAIEWLRYENSTLKNYASMPCNSCVALNDNLEKAMDEIMLLESNASLPCVSCESLLAEIKELKLTHTTCVDELEHARSIISELESMPSVCSLSEVACQTSCDADSLHNDICCIHASCTSCIDLKNEVEALKILRDDMSAKLLKHNEMSAKLEKKLELLRTTCAKPLDSHNSCHSDFDAFKVAPSQSDLTSSLKRESLDVGTCDGALDSSSIAIPKLVASSSVAQDDSSGKGASYFFGTHISKPNFHCTFCKKDGHTVGFCFRRVKHERRVRAKAFRKPRSLFHGTCDPNVGTRPRVVVDASCSKSQGTSHFNENGDSSSRTVPPDRPLYHCSFCEKDGHQKSFCYRRARHMRRVRSSRPLVVHSLSHGMNTCEPSERPRFVDGFYDSFSSGIGHVRGHASSASSVGPRHVSHGAYDGPSSTPSGGHCLFAGDCTRFPSRVLPLRHVSKGTSKPFHLNRHLHHANPHDKLSASFTRVTKYWIPKHLLANPSVSKTRSSLSPHV